MESRDVAMAEIAMVGLGRMGGNMARRLIRGGIRVAALNRSFDVTEKLAKETGLTACRDYAQLVAQLAAPRVIWLMLPAGKTTEEAMQQLLPLLSKGDVLINGANAFYKESQSQSEIAAKHGVAYVDAGVSGGVWGLANGYTIMLGGEARAVRRVAPFAKLLAPAGGWLHCGPSGAGHYVKMIHNGIEYGLMQAYAEGFALLAAKRDFGLDLAAVSELWRHGSVVRSWLLDLMADNLKRDPALAGIAPVVADSGEGRWTAIEAVELGVPAPVISLALAMRFASQGKGDYGARQLAQLRNSFGGHAVKSAGARGGSAVRRIKNARRLVVRIGRADVQRSHRTRLQRRDAESKSRIRVEAVTRGARVAVFPGYRQQAQHQIGLLHAGRAAQIGLRGRRTNREQSFALEYEAQSHLHPQQRIAQHVVDGNGFRALERQPHVRMIVQILADAGQVVHGADAELPQHLRVADSGQLQYLRRLERTRREHDFTARPDLQQRSAARHFIPRRTPAFGQHARRDGIGQYRQIRALDRRTQISGGGARAQAVARRVLKIKCALVVAAIIVIRYLPETRLPARRQKSIRQFIELVETRATDRPAAAARPKVPTPICRKTHRSVTPSLAPFSRIARIAPASESTNVTSLASAAPRERASNPYAPDPAAASRTRPAAAKAPGPRRSKTAFRAMSVVGRAPAGTTSLRPRNVPPVIRINGLPRPPAAAARAPRRSAQRLCAAPSSPPACAPS